MKLLIYVGTCFALLCWIVTFYPSLKNYETGLAMGVHGCWLVFLIKDYLDKFLKANNDKLERLKKEYLDF